MKIKFLGTSAGWPLPRLGCKDKICSSTDNKDIRTRSQALVNDILLLDLGPDTYTHLKNPKVDPTKIKYAAITHEHPDHTLGLWDLSHTYLNGKRTKIKVIVSPRTLSKIRFMFFPNEYIVLKTNPDQKMVVDGLKISLLPVNHTKDSSFGIFVEEGSRKLFWAPDFKSLPAETIKIIKGSNLIAVDGSELQVRTPSHQTIEEGIELARQIGPKMAYFIHLGHRILPHTKLETFVKERGGDHFNIAYDGLEVEI
ncbi:MAG TPA: MBL fold metallo-hydrolase [Candidatus Nanoarchaeia archaeon]